MTEAITVEGYVERKKVKQGRYGEYAGVTLLDPATGARYWFAANLDAVQVDDALVVTAEGADPGDRGWHFLRKARITERNLEPVEAPKPREAVKVDVSGVIALFKRAQDKGAKRIAIRLRTTDGDPVRLTLAGQAARIPGSVNVTDGGPFGANEWYGRITRDGEWQQPRKGVPAAVEAIVQAFAAKPDEVGRLYGQITGNCCFCTRELTTKESLHVGYGPICADKFGLPWGEVDAE